MIVALGLLDHGDLCTKYGRLMKGRGVVVVRDVVEVIVVPCVDRIMVSRGIIEWLAGFFKASSMGFFVNPVLKEVYLVDGFSCWVKDFSLLRCLRYTHVVVVD